MGDDRDKPAPTGSASPLPSSSSEAGSPARPRGTPVGGRDPEGSAQNDVSLVVETEPFIYLGNCACAANLEQLRILLTSPKTGKAGAIVNTAGNFPCLYPDEFTYKQCAARAGPRRPALPPAHRAAASCSWTTASRRRAVRGGGRLVLSGHRQVFDWFDEAAAFIDEQRRAGRRVLVHCMQGFSRSATMLLAYLVGAQRMPLCTAFELLCSKRTIRPNRFFLEQLLEYERRKLGATSISLGDLFATGYSVQGDEAYVERSLGERVLHGFHRAANKLNSVRVFARVLASSDLRTSSTVVGSLLSYWVRPRTSAKQAAAAAAAAAPPAAPPNEPPAPAAAAEERNAIPAGQPRVRSAGPGARHSGDEAETAASPVPAVS